jgi:hypothetical protein
MIQMSCDRRLCLTRPTNKLRQFVRQLILTRVPGLSPAKRLQKENELIYQYRNRPQWAQGTLHEILDRLGLFCLSATPINPLLWAHYAHGHRGVCIEVNSNAGLFLAAQQVNYTDQPPVINRVLDSGSEIIAKSALTKGIDWAYEREWRVIARWKDADRTERYFEQHGVVPGLAAFMQSQHGPGYYSFPPGAIRSLIIGSSVIAEGESWLRSVIEKAPRAIAIRRASLARDGTMTVA